MCRLSLTTGRARWLAVCGNTNKAGYAEYAYGGILIPSLQSNNHRFSSSDLSLCLWRSQIYGSSFLLSSLEDVMLEASCGSNCCNNHHGICGEPSLVVTPHLNPQGGKVFLQVAVADSLVQSSSPAVETEKDNIEARNMIFRLL